VRIGIIVDNEFDNDIRVQKEVRILKDLGNSIFVLCFAYSGKKYNIVEGIDIERIIIKKKWRDLLFMLFNRFPVYEWIWAKRTAQFVRNNNIQVIHTHDLYMSKCVRRGIKKSGQKATMILDLHENYPDAILSYNWTKGFVRNLVVNPKKWKSKEKNYLNQADKIIVLSEDFKQELCKKYTFLITENISVYENVIDLKRFDKYTINPEIQKLNGFTMLYFGQVAERRGVFDTIKVLDEVLKQQKNTNLLIIGPIDRSDKEKFELEINRPNLKNHIRHIPWIDVSELPSYLNISDLCLSPLHINPQHESGVANKIFQYMFGAKPLLVSACRPQKNLVEKHNCGLAYTDFSDFVQKVLYLSQNPNECKRLGENGKTALYSDFSSEKFDSVLVNLYKIISQSI